MDPRPLMMEDATLCIQLRQHDDLVYCGHYCPCFGT